MVDASRCHVDLGPGDIVLDGDPAPPSKGAQKLPLFLAHVYCCQTATAEHLSKCKTRGLTCRPNQLIHDSGPKINTTGQSNLTERPHHRRFIPPTRVQKLNSISICSAIFAQLTRDCLRACPSTSFPQKIAPLHGRISTPIHGSCSPPEPTALWYNCADMAS